MRDIDKVMGALRSPTRREILGLIWSRELRAGEIAAAFDLTKPTISQHLSVLREAGLVAERRSGTRRLYRARPERLRELRAWLRDFWGDALDDLKDAAENEIQQHHGAADEHQ